MDDLDIGITNVVFKAKVFNRYGTFDQIAKEHGRSKICIFAL